MSYTPGPWANTDGFIYSNATEDRETIAQLHTHYIIDRNSMGTREYNNLEANANLISAAPDLLEALEEALPGIEELNGEFQEGWDSTINKMKSAIKKARGL